jgi:hypothetical protein
MAETKQWQNDGGEFIPNPATFLNGSALGRQDTGKG